VKKSKKGQISFEFLMTYGWAFLIALVAIGALAYFGVFKPPTPKKCMFSSEVTCQDFLLKQGNPNDEVKLRLTNNMGTTVSVSLINITTATGSQVVCASSTPAIPTTWTDGSVLDITFSCAHGATSVFNSGSKIKLGVKVNYFDIQSTNAYTHVLNGELYDTVQ
jgi:hypothetical protein